MRAEPYTGDLLSSLIGAVVTAEQHAISELEKMNAIQDACRILVNARQEIASASLSVWQILKHAERHLDNEMRQLLAEDSDAR